MIGDFLHDWVFPILLVLTIAILIFGGGYFVIRTGVRLSRAGRYCYNLGLSGVTSAGGSYYCTGLKDGNTIVIPVPDSVLRKE